MSSKRTVIGIVVAAAIMTGTLVAPLFARPAETARPSTPQSGQSYSVAAADSSGRWDKLLNRLAGNLNVSETKLRDEIKDVKQNAQGSISTLSSSQKPAAYIHALAGELNVSDDKVRTAVKKTVLSAIDETLQQAAKSGLIGNQAVGQIMDKLEDKLDEKLK